MDLIERYLGAIRRNLPARNADDIVAELRDALASRIEEREDSLGRPLTPEEVETLVKGFGHPLVVAARYRKQQWLIGPDVFPFYLLVVRIVLLAVVGVQAAIGLVRLSFGDETPVQALSMTIGGLSTSLIFSLAIVTVIFVVLERSGFPAEHLQRWNPAQLADVEDEQPGPWKSAAEVALTIAFLLWWAGLFSLPFAIGGAGFRIEPAPIFAELYWPIFALAAARLVHNLIQWLRPRWQGRAAADRRRHRDRRPGAARPDLSRRPLGDDRLHRHAGPPGGRAADEPQPRLQDRARRGRPGLDLPMPAGPVAAEPAGARPGGSGLGGAPLQRVGGLVHQLGEDVGDGRLLLDHADRLAGHDRAGLDVALDHRAAQRAGPIMLDLELGLGHLDLPLVEQLRRPRAAWRRSFPSRDS